MPRLYDSTKKAPAVARRGLFYCCKFWWASRESNTAPTDYESAALTKHELEARGLWRGGAVDTRLA